MSKFLETQRGGPKLIYDGFGYVKRRANGNTITWLCDQKATASCRAYARTRIDAIDGDEVELLGQHTHARNPSKYDITAIKNALKRRAVESMDESASQLAAGLITAAAISTTVGLPKLDSLARSVRQHRFRNRVQTGQATKSAPRAKRSARGNASAAGGRSQNLTDPIQISNDNIADEPNEDFMAAETIQDKSSDGSPRRPVVATSTGGVTTFGPFRNGPSRLTDQISTGARNPSLITPDQSMAGIERRVLLLKERAMEEKLQRQREKKAIYAKINTSISKFDTAIDEFRRYVAEQRMIIRGADVSDLPMDLPPGMHGFGSA